MDDSERTCAAGYGDRFRVDGARKGRRRITATTLVTPGAQGWLSWLERASNAADGALSFGIPNAETAPILATALRSADYQMIGSTRLRKLRIGERAEFVCS
jgi:hypothetical protein